MKQVEFFRQKIARPGKHKELIIVHREWKFADDEVALIKTIVTKIIKMKPGEIAELFNRDQYSSTFINSLETLCQDMRSIQSSMKRADITEQNNKILKDCTTALNHLKKIERGKLELISFNKIPFKDDPEVKHNSELTINIIENAWKAAGALDAFIKTMKVIPIEKRKRGEHDSADANKFIEGIKRACKKYICDPKEYSTGFRDLVSLCQIAAECKYHKAPDRGIKKAYKKTDGNSP